jgi:hypothetical protein
MEMDSMKQMVIQASTTFYTTQDKEQRRTAEEWLNEFKKSAGAWYVADQILHSSRDEQALFFAAQTIRTKIQSSFHELPVTSHEVSAHLFAVSLPIPPLSGLGFSLNCMKVCIFTQIISLLSSIYIKLINFLFFQILIFACELCKINRGIAAYHNIKRRFVKNRPNLSHSLYTDHNNKVQKKLKGSEKRKTSLDGFESFILMQLL